VRNLEERSALWVAKHLVMAGRLVDDDPELAFQHALAASRRGGRLAAVREAVGVTAYAAGHYGEALREFRTFRRISGSNVHLPVMADCERGLGRPDRALDLARSEEAASLDAAGKAELAMVVSGARTDLGQLDAAVAALEIPQLDLQRAFSFSPRLFRAYADALDAVGRSSESGKWRRQAGVAERALGLDDELEPDIIDLGEDDEPAPVPVPRVADLLGAPASAGATEGPEVTEDAVDGVGAGEGQAVDEGDTGIEGGTSDTADAAGAAEPEPAVEGDVEPGADHDVEVAAGADSAPSGVQMPIPVDGISSDTGSFDAGSSEEVELILEDDPTEEGSGTTSAAAPSSAAPGSAGDEATEDATVTVDAVPVGESAAPVQALQTEMLFSMDDSGTADIVDAADTVQQTRGSAPALAVRFSEPETDTGTITGTDTGTDTDTDTDTATDTQASDAAPGSASEDGPETKAAAPKRKRATEPAVTEDDGVDD
jgi:hypothetical protein